MAMNFNEAIVDIEFINIFPSKNSEEFVFLLTAITDENNRVLVYAPMVRVENTIEMLEDQDWDLDFTKRHIPLSALVQSRTCRFLTDVYAVKESRSNNHNFFKIIYLDDDFHLVIRKKDIEKLFGCVIDG